MKRLHLHVSVPSIDEAVAFYSTLFDAPPSVVKADYAKSTAYGEDEETPDPVSNACRAPATRAKAACC
jgi:predicted enzyme related to lactoylglutathione lyase